MTKKVKVVCRGALPFEVHGSQTQSLYCVERFSRIVNWMHCKYERAEHGIILVCAEARFVYILENNVI